jgi:NADH dehydrogenase FAD-containing subunit
VVEAGLAGDDGRIAVDPATLETNSASVFAAGDLALVGARDGLAAPQSLDLSRRQAITVARQIAARIGGGNPPGPLDGKARWFVEVGAGAGTMISGDFLREPGAARIAQPSIVWHWAKAVQEKQWLYRWY